MLTRDQLLDFARGPDSDAYDRAIDVQISRLRRKLEDGGGGPGPDPHHPQRGLHVRRQGRAPMSSSQAPGGPTATLFVQVLALVMASLVAAQLITTLVIFNLPPPDPDVYRLSEVAHVLGGGRRPPSARPLVARVQAARRATSTAARCAPRSSAAWPASSASRPTAWPSCRCSATRR